MVPETLLLAVYMRYDAQPYARSRLAWSWRAEPFRGGNGFDIFGSVEASDDAVWNQDSVWMAQPAASPRQRRRFNEVYSSLASFKERNRSGGTHYPRVPEVGGQFRGSMRLNAMHASLPGMGRDTMNGL